MKPVSKTGRKRGAIWKAIREFARRRRRFSTTGLLRAMTIKQANANCAQLYQRGELELIKPGRGHFCYYQRPVYRATTTLRKPELTNKHKIGEP